jgi:WXXGXW repeat (2 copies)
MRLFRSARWLLLALLISLVPASSYAGVFISVNFGPPVLPVYVQPVCPEPDLIWTPGYWGYGPDGYFWVPGAWVPAPFVGGLWTPGYWGWSSGMYIFHPGYWGYHVGYYGGVNYGGGYLGIGFAGGEWRGGHMAYNTAVVNVNTTVIHTTFVDRTVVDRYTVANPNHVAYAGGPGGIQHQAAPEERIAEHETHTPPTSFQAQHVQAAQTDRTSYARNNGGHPANVAVARPLPVETHPAPAMNRASDMRPATPSPANHPGTVSPRTTESPRTNPAPKPSPKAQRPAPRQKEEEPKK